jgi:hypothetical protein
LEILPQEQFFFRQDVQFGKKRTCTYQDCWENNSFNQKSQYCHLHQKMIKSYTANLFDKLYQHIEKWEDFLDSLKKSNNIISIGNLTNLVKEYSGYVLSYKDKEFILEIYKSFYDDNGLLIKDEVQQSISDYSNKKLTTNDINQKFVMLSRIDQVGS